MILFNKTYILRLLLVALCFVFLTTFLLDYIGYKANQISPFEKLSARKILKGQELNKSYNGFALTAPLAALGVRDNANLTVISKTKNNFESSNKIAASNLSFTFSNWKERNMINTRVPKGKHCENPNIESGAFQGPIKPNLTLVTLDAVEEELKSNLLDGGFFSPKNCVPKDHVAIIVPFRDRYAHLSIFLRNMHPFLMMQNISYRIFVVEQTNGKPFNRAALMNVGYIEALKIYPWDCFIFHDVDLLPLDDRNIYNCPRQPRHLSVAIDTFHFKLPYRTIFGGVSAMTTEHFKIVNGFSNSFFGWGGEDDDMSNRIKHSNLFISRYPINIARYTMMKHQKEKANPKRFENLVNGITKMESDGINSIKYELYSFKKFPIFTWFLVELKISPEPKI